MPTAAYAVSQLLVLIGFALFAFDTLSSLPSPSVSIASLKGTGAVLIIVSVLALPPTPLVGVLDGLARRTGKRTWRIAAAVPVVALGCWIAAVAPLLAGISSPGVLPDGGPDPFPLGPYLGALVVAEASLALSWVVALWVSRLGGGGRLRGEED